MLLRLRQTFALVYIVLVMVGTYPFALVSRGAARGSMRWFWAGGWLWLAGVRVRTRRSPEPLPTGPAVWVANHASALDIPILCRALGQPPRFVAKHELGRVPLLGYYIRRIGGILVDPTKAREAVRRLEHVVQTIEGRHHYCFFAEGERSTDGRVHRFRRGAFQAAIRGNAVVIPVAIVGSDVAMPRGRWLPRPADVQVAVGAPIHAEADESPAELAARTRARIGEMHVELGGGGLAGEAH